MLKGVDRAISAELLHVLMLMGHGDDLVICDVNHPAATIAKHTAYGKLIDVTKMLHDAGVMIVFGTDTGGSFTYHRELELYQKAGFTAPEILKRATFDSELGCHGIPH